MPVQIHTPRLMLRSITEDDAATLHETYGDPEAMRFIGIGPAADLEETRRRVGRLMNFEREHGFSLFAVVERATGLVVGDCGLLPVAESDDSVELGYRLGRAHWGKGYATEASEAVRDHAFGVVGLARLVAVVKPGNDASARVLEKIGFARVADDAVTKALFGKYAVSGVMGFTMDRQK